MPDDPNYVALRHYIESLLLERDKALTLSREVIDNRLERMNEFRDQIERERGEYLTRELFDATNKATLDRISSLEAWRAWSLGAGSVLVLLAGMLGAVASKILGL